VVVLTCRRGDYVDGDVAAVAAPAYVDLAKAIRRAPG